MAFWAGGSVLFDCDSAPDVFNAPQQALERALKLEPISLTVLDVLLSFVERQMSVP